jgi:xylulokinase
MTDDYFAAIDLGTTNIKAALYRGETLSLVASCSRPMEYFRQDKKVEFNCDDVIHKMMEMLWELGANAPPGSVKNITLTGQAESLVLLDGNYKPIRRAISWMDERSAAESTGFSEYFSPDEIYRVTGQKAVITTWPASKIVSISLDDEESFTKTAFYVLLKDYAVYKLTGILAADKSIATFSLYFDIFHGCYWKEMLNFCGIKPSQLPPLVEPCTIIGGLDPAIDIGAAYSQAQVNTGTLDHFAGMIGSGNIAPGALSESCGTVMVMASMIRLPISGKETMALHYGPFPETMVFLQVAESGGICLEWFKNNFLPDLSFSELDDKVLKTGKEKNLLFLPYMAGVNAPEFDREACGVFFGLRAETGVFDMARAVMEGVAFLLNKNLDDMRNSGLDFSHLICTGGAAKSDLWSQIKADICNCEILIPEDSETACRGAAIIGAVTGGSFTNYEEAVKKCVKMKKQFVPKNCSIYKAKKAGFNALYKSMLNTISVLKE